MRILAINSRGFGQNNYEKVNMLKQVTIDYEINVVLLSSADRKWNESRKSSLKTMFKSINKHVEIIASDSGEETRTNDRYLPGGTVAIYTGKIAGMIIQEQTKQDRMGRWMSTRIEGGTQKMQIINLYRIPDSIQEGILKSRAQYDHVGGVVKISKEYRNKMIKELNLEIKKLKDEGIEGILITGNMN